MADLTVNQQTLLPAEEVLVRAVHFFSTEKWRATSQSGRSATFEGKPPIPWGLMLLTLLAYLACIVPGVILHITVISKIYRFHNLVVTANPLDLGTEVVVSYPKATSSLVQKFLGGLPPLSTAA